MNRNRKGFTLIELLIVVAIIGIIVAIAIPNLLNAIQRGRQKRSMGDLRTIGTGVEAYAIDFNVYPPGAAYSLPTGLAYPNLTVKAKLYSYVEPTYVKTLPLKDGWNSWFLYSFGTNNQDYGLSSNGKDGAAGPSPFGATTDFNADLVFVDGQFVQYPEGAQNN